MHVRRPALIGTGGDAKPRVVLVDDHPGVLKAVSAMLSSDYLVAGVATGGRQAVEIVPEIQPDAVVLDINMADLDGFQTMEALERAGVQAPVVVLSMVPGDDVVGHAFRCGADGYVLKPRVASDLASAIDHVLQGRRFLPSLPFLAGQEEGGGHVLHLYRELASSLDDLADLFAQTLRRGDVACVIATEPVRDSLDGRLRDRGWDVGLPSVRRRYRALDTAEALSGFMRGGLPDPQRLADLAADLEQYRRDAAERLTSRLTIFGDMAAVLNTCGNADAALALERHWHALTRDLPFLTICGYHVSGLSDGRPDVWPGVCAEHGALSHATDL